MTNRWSDVFTFIVGGAQSDHIVYVVASDDELEKEDISHSIFLCWFDGEWKHIAKPMPWMCTSVCINTSLSVPRMFGLGMWGDVLIFNSLGEYETEVIKCGETIPEMRGPLRKIRSIDGQVFVSGTDHQVYRRIDRNQWESIGPRVELSTIETSSFESLDGFSKNDVYAVGTSGEIWHFDGLKWREVDGVTNIHLNNVLCAEDGNVYICGRQGILIVGRGERWRVIEQDVTEDDFWDICEFGNAIYLSTLSGIYCLGIDANILSEVSVNRDVKEGYYQLSASESILWSIGPKSLLTFDGTTWREID